MRKRTRNAILDSINFKWVPLSKGEGSDHGCQDCSLCSLFYRSYAPHCKKCPVFKRTKLSDCHGSPYWNYKSCLPMDKQFVAGREIEFLTSLLPKRFRTPKYIKE